MTTRAIGFGLVGLGALLLIAVVNRWLTGRWL